MEVRLKKKLEFFSGAEGLSLQQLSETLWTKGYRVYLAGGCVRDRLLGRPFKDIDVVTDADMDTIQKLFKKTVPVGIQFGIVRVFVNGVEFEVARFRKDGPYQDGRHPESIEFSSPEEDAHRRDFTINGLFYDLKSEEVIDYVGGLDDLKKGLIRAVGEPQARFSEDYLRILRLVRFSLQLDFQLDPSTAQAAQSLVSHIKEVSGERLQVEIGKIIALNPRKAFELFDHWGLCQILFPHWVVEKGLKLDLGGQKELGVLFALWLLNFQKSNCEKAIEILEEQAERPWRYGTVFSTITDETVQCFRLGRADQKLLKEIASLPAWGPLWFRWRPGVRGALAQSEEFTRMAVINKDLSFWPEEMTSEVKHWQSQSRLVPFLTGKDVLSLSPQKRGLVLRECLYLQYEKTLKDREQALAWLSSQVNN